MALKLTLRPEVSCPDLVLQAGVLQTELAFPDVLIPCSCCAINFLSSAQRAEMCLQAAQGRLDNPAVVMLDIGGGGGLRR